MTEMEAICCPVVGRAGKFSLRNIFVGQSKENSFLSHSGPAVQQATES